MLAKITQFMAQQSIAVDLGTANTRIYSPRYGCIHEKPSACGLTDISACDTADEYLQYTNRKLATRPLRGGVIVDLKKAVTLLKPLIDETRYFLSHPVALTTAPTDATDKERDLLRKALKSSGASHVSIIPEVWAAAIGAGIDITLPHAQLLLDIGDGVTDMAVFRHGRILYSTSLRIACSDLQRSVRSAIMAKHRIQLFDHDAELLTHAISALADHHQSPVASVTLFALDVVKRCKVVKCVNTKDVVEAMAPVTEKILNMIETGLQKLPENIYCEILESGICLTGGGACIEGMDRLIASRTNIATKAAANPLHAVINGARETLHYWSDKKCWWENIDWPTLTM